MHQTLEDRRKIHGNQEDRGEHILNSRGQEEIYNRNLEEREKTHESRRQKGKMHRIVENRKKKPPKSVGQEEKSTEIQRSSD